MPSPEFNVVQSVTKSIQYTGSNSADIDIQVPGVSITSEVDGVLTLNGGQFILNTNDWILFNSVMITTLSNNQWLNEWGCVALCSELNEVVADLDDVTDDLLAATSFPALRAFGVAPVPTLLASQSTTVAVPITPAMPDSSYTATAQLFAGIAIGALQINSVTVVDEDTVNVAVQNTGLVSLSGANVMVVTLQ